MAGSPNSKQQAWALFDRIVADAAPAGLHSNPWIRSADCDVRYEPDFSALERLLAVPLQLGAETQSGVPALALDVWLSYELRRAGFDADATWPRAQHPRILPMPIVQLLRAVTAKEREALQLRLRKASSVQGVTSASASILGKNYFKQVDVIMTDWMTGPQLLISTKRMDSSYGNNAANRVEESYGDAKNLRLRHPLAAIGFVFGLRSDILDTQPDTAAWLIDLLGKLGREDDAYHATCLVMIEYGGDAPAGLPAEIDEPLVAAGIETDPTAQDTAPDLTTADLDQRLGTLPRVSIRHDAIPQSVSPARFMETMVRRVLDVTPINLHKESRRRMAEPVDSLG